MTPETRQNHLRSINIINVFSDTSNTHDHIKITPWEREMNHIATGRALSLGGELPGGMPEQRFCPPKLVVDGGGAAELFVEIGFVF